MNLFLIASVHGKKKYEQNYQQLVTAVKNAGHKIFADHIFEASSEMLQSRSEKEVSNGYKKLIQKLKRADAVFAEISYGSTSAGYLIATAVSLNKPVVVFYSGTEEPNLLKDLEAVQDRLVVVRYEKLEDLDREVPMMIEFINDSQDTRFNFFISPSLSTYLNWVSKQKRVPRSVYLRKLIDEDIEENVEYSGG